MEDHILPIVLVLIGVIFLNMFNMSKGIQPDEHYSLPTIEPLVTLDGEDTGLLAGAYYQIITQKGQDGSRMVLIWPSKKSIQLKAPFLQVAPRSTGTYDPDGPDFLDSIWMFRATEALGYYTVHVKGDRGFLVNLMDKDDGGERLERMNLGFDNVRSNEIFYQRGAKWRDSVLFSVKRSGENNNGTFILSPKSDPEGYFVVEDRGHSPLGRFVRVQTDHDEHVKSSGPPTLWKFLGTKWVLDSCDCKCSNSF